MLPMKMHKKERPLDRYINQWHNRLCKRIIELRLKQKRPRVDVAVGANLNPNYYGRIERGITGYMRMSTLIKIKQSLGVKWVDILGPKDPMLAFLDEKEYEDES